MGTSNISYVVIEDDTRKIVISGKASKIAEYFDVTESTIYNAYRGGYLFKGKYRVGVQKGAVYELYSRDN